jgi:hypothetical protein
LLYLTERQQPQPMNNFKLKQHCGDSDWYYYHYYHDSTTNDFNSLALDNDVNVWTQNKDSGDLKTNSHFNYDLSDNGNNDTDNVA